MTYIANKPVRFDRDYRVGEIIPGSVIDPAAVKRLIAWGKITENTAENRDNTQYAEKLSKSKKAAKE